MIKNKAVRAAGIVTAGSALIIGFTNGTASGATNATSPGQHAVSGKKQASDPSGCRSFANNIRGAAIRGVLCWNEWAEPTPKNYHPGNPGETVLKDTARDGRSAELWSYTPGYPRWKHQSTIGGVNKTVDLSGAWWGVVNGKTSQTSLKICTSDAGSDRKCSGPF
ncbi:hypothetical protein [Streptomyces sp. RK9]|uniref:hypothetical protein n=1 Tax=Streptomyces sp. RK9 TaxID=3239284 RepID=UPI00386ADC16